MSQIPDNMLPDSYNYNNSISKKAEQPDAAPTPAPEPETKSDDPKLLDKDPAAFLGKTQIRKKSRYNLNALDTETVNNMKSDLQFMSIHPEQVAKADRIFDVAYKQAKASGDPDPYAKAAAIQAEYLSEFN